jgi:prevent-host-death family protein
MTKLTITKARARFSKIMSRVAQGKERVVLTRWGKDLVAIVPVEDLAYSLELTPAAAHQIRKLDPTFQGRRLRTPDEGQSAR